MTRDYSSAYYQAKKNLAEEKSRADTAEARAAELADIIRDLKPHLKDFRREAAQGGLECPVCHAPVGVAASGSVWRRSIMKHESWCAVWRALKVENL